MGDLIEGIGDEVLLFVGFLVLSLIFLSYFTFRNRQAPPRRPAAAATPPVSSSSGSQPQEEPTGANPNRENHATQRSGETGSNSDQSYVRPLGEDGLRSRFRGTEASSNQSGTNSEPGGTTAGDISGDDASGRSQDNDDGNDITIRLIRAGGSGHAQEIHTTATCTIDYLRRTHFQEELSRFCPVKFIYQGRVISEDSTTLSDLNISNGGAMHVHIGRPRPPGAAPEPPDPEILDLSPFFVPLFGVMLGIVWVVMLIYPEIFTLMTKVFLFFLSFGYVVLAYVTTYGN